MLQIVIIRSGAPSIPQRSCLTHGQATIRYQGNQNNGRPKYTLSFVHSPSFVSFQIEIISNNDSLVLSIALYFKSL